MKTTPFSLLLFISLLMPALALDLVTPGGTFKDVTVTKVEAEALRIAHSEGTALVDFDELPPAMQAEYGWTPEKSAARKAAKEAEIKRMEEEERMIEEAPKRKAMEEAAKKKAGEDRVAEEERAKRKVMNAEVEKEVAADLQEQISASAAARAEIERARARAKLKPGEVLPEEADSSIPVATIDPPAPKRNIVVPPFGTVSSLLEPENSWTRHRSVWIGVGIATLVVFVLFLLPSGSRKKLPRR